MSKKYNFKSDRLEIEKKIEKKKFKLSIAF